jgi:3'-phosphoadenosine 5'-phosphosulfate (PAPS) 3'-phosphatase
MLSVDQLIQVPGFESLEANRLVQFVPILRRILVECLETEREVSIKSHDFDLVSSSDVKIGQMWRDALPTLFPEATFVCEEMPETHSLLCPRGKFAISDPIDGTFNFLKGGKQYGSMISVWETGTPIETIIFQPGAFRTLYMISNRIYIWEHIPNTVRQIFPRDWKKTQGERGVIISHRDYLDNPYLTDLISVQRAWDPQSMVELGFTIALDDSRAFHFQSVGKVWDWAPYVHLLINLGFTVVNSVTFQPWNLFDTSLGAISFLEGDDSFLQQLQQACQIQDLMDPTRF